MLFEAKDWKEIAERRPFKSWNPGDLIWVRSYSKNSKIKIEAGVFVGFVPNNFGWTIVSVFGASDTKIKVSLNENWEGIPCGS